MVRNAFIRAQLLDSEMFLHYSDHFKKKSCMLWRFGGVNMGILAFGRVKGKKLGGIIWLRLSNSCRMAQAVWENLASESRVLQQNSFLRQLAIYNILAE